MLCPHMVERAEELSGVSFTRALIPFMRANHLPKTPLPNTIPLGIRLQCINLGGCKHLLYSIYSNMFGSY